MTQFERRLARGVVDVWMFLSVCTSVIRIGKRIAGHYPVFISSALFFEWVWLIQGICGGILAVYVWRNARRRFRFLWFSAVAVVLFAINEIICVTSWLALRPYILPQPKSPMKVVIFSAGMVDLSHFFILTIGAIAATLMIRSYHESVDAEREAAALETQLAGARMLNVRNQVQPALMRESLEAIEQLLPHDTARAEAQLLNLSDFLRLALLRTKQSEWSSAMEAEYGRLHSDVSVAVTR